MSRVGDRIRFTVTGTPGAGSFTAASAPSTYLLPGSSVPAISDQDVVSYVAVDGSNWETGRGVWTSSSGVLTRGVIESSNANTLVTFSSSVVVTVTFLQTDLAQTVYDSILAGDGALPTVNIPAGWANFRIELLARCVPSTSETNRSALVKFNADSGANYSFYSIGAGNNSATPFVAFPTANGGSAGIYMGWVSTTNGPTNEFGFAEATVYNYASTAMNKKVKAEARLRDSTGATYVSETHGTYHPASPAALTSFSIANDIATSFKTGTRLRLIMLP